MRDSNVIRKSAFCTVIGMLMMLFAVSAFAETPGYYVGGNVGLIIPTDSKFKDPTSGDVTITYNPGYTLSAVGGYKFENNFRVEGEFGSKAADTDKASVPGVGTARYDSTVSVVNLLANVYYDIKTPALFGITPYLGGGIGVAYLMTNDGIVSGPGGSARTINESGDTVFAYQVGVGTAFDVTKNVTLDLGYRYFATTEGKFDTSIGTTDKVDFSSHNFIVGARYNF